MKKEGKKKSILFIYKSWTKKKMQFAIEILREKETDFIFVRSEWGERERGLVIIITNVFFYRISSLNI